MSMICNLVAITPDELRELIENPTEILDVFFPDDGAGQRRERHLDIDKSWHGVHYLLTGDPWEGEPPLSWAVLGGTGIGEDTGYGPPRYLTPDEVRDVADALDDASPESLTARFDPVAMKAEGIYPQGWQPEDLGWLLGNFDDLAGFYGVAAAEGRVVLLCLS